MRFLLAAVFCIIGATSAQAAGVAFPPDNCSESSPYMAFSAIEGSNTYCNSGQDVIKNALHECLAGQSVTYDGAKFYCKSDDVPTCTSSQFLSYNGSAYECRTIGIPACNANQVLTFNGTNYYCVNRTDSIPTCNTNQFLTYNGTNYQCVTVNTPTVPECAAGQVLTGRGGQMVCVAAPTDNLAGRITTRSTNPTTVGAPYASCTAYCEAGETVIGGSCNASNSYTNYSYRAGENGWYCFASTWWASTLAVQCNAFCLR